MAETYTTGEYIAAYAQLVAEGDTRGCQKLRRMMAGAKGKREFAAGRSFSADQQDVKTLLHQLSQPEHGPHMAGLDDPLGGLRGIAADALDEQGRGDEARLLRAPGTHVEVRADGTVKPSFMERQGYAQTYGGPHTREQFVKPSHTWVDPTQEPGYDPVRDADDHAHHSMTYWFATFGHPAKVGPLPGGGYGMVTDESQPKQWYWNPADGEGIHPDDVGRYHPRYREYPSTEELPDAHPLSPSELAFMHHHATTPKFRPAAPPPATPKGGANVEHPDPETFSDVASGHAAFQAQIAKKPTDATARKVYADWIEENDPQSATPEALHHLRTHEGAAWVAHGADGKVATGRKWTMPEIKAANKAAGRNWFDPGAMRAFGTRLLPNEVHHGPGGVFFVHEGDDFYQTRREYRVAGFDPETGETFAPSIRFDGVSHDPHATVEAARAQAQQLAGGHFKRSA